MSHSANGTGLSPNVISTRSSICIRSDSGQWIATGGTAGRSLIWRGRIALFNTPSVVMPGSFTARPISCHQSTQSVRSRPGDIDQNLPFADQPLDHGAPPPKPGAQTLFLIPDP